MKKLLKMAMLATSLVAGSAIAAPIATGPLDADAYVTFKGYDLAWASPCNTGLNGNTCSMFDLSGQAAYGWKIMTLSLFQNLGFDYNVFAVNYSSSNTQAYNGRNFVKASKWFNASYSHIDVSNGQGGLWSFADYDVVGTYGETIAYRTNSNAASVSSPTPIALLGLGLLGLALRRKTK